MLGVSRTFPYDMVACFEGVNIARAMSWVLGEGKESSPEFTCVGVSSAALYDASKYLLVAFEL